jgi:hypothetical protein
VRRADELLADNDRPPVPAGLSAHKLRHTFTSLLAACGEDPAYIMGQLGHSDPKFTLRVYTHVMRRDDGERERLRALVEGFEWAPMGTGGEIRGDRATRTPRMDPKKPPNSRDLPSGRGWFRTSDLSRVKRWAAAGQDWRIPCKSPIDSARWDLHDRLNTDSYGCVWPNEWDNGRSVERAALHCSFGKGA